MFAIFSLTTSLVIATIISQRNNYREKLEELNRKQTSIINKQVEHISSIQFKLQLADLASRVAHDIRGPLMALRAVQYKVSPRLNSQELSLLSKTVDQIDGIAEDILQKRPKKEYEEKTYIYPVLNEIIHGEFPGTDKLVKFDADIGFTQGHLVVGQANRLKSVLENVVRNAVESYENSKIALIIIRGKIVKKEIFLKFIDKGVGMSINVLSRLGEEGFSTKCTSMSGYGIGVYSSLSILKQWGGQMNFESTPGKGTTVTVSLKIVHQD